MEMPKGRRSSEPIPGAAGQGQSPGQQRGHGGHHDGTETQEARFINGGFGFLPSLRSASSAKSIIMIPFFLTIPKRIIPMSF